MMVPVLPTPALKLNMSLEVPELQLNFFVLQIFSCPCPYQVLLYIVLGTISMFAWKVSGNP
jgi:hypothetical protein